MTKIHKFIASMYDRHLCAICAKYSGHQNHVG
jgi:hypothetical protein